MLILLQKKIKGVPVFWERLFYNRRLPSLFFMSLYFFQKVSTNSGIGLIYIKNSYNLPDSLNFLSAA